MTLLRRRLRCHYCNTQSRDSVSDIPRVYLCRHCDAVNHFDERGNITDPPLEEVATAPAASSRFIPIQSRSPSPAMSSPNEELFCNTCQHNQFILKEMLAEYIPDDDDPEYDKRVETADAYREELEERYPQVCQSCKGRVQDQIRAAGYVAKADHLRRMMEKSNMKRTTVQTSRQTWTLRVIGLAKWTYIASIAAGVLWHALGVIMVPEDEGMLADREFHWDVCLQQAVFVRQVDESCVMSPSVVKWVYYALAADLLTIWWNPKLASKTNSITGRMRGLVSLWAIRAAVLSLRIWSVGSAHFQNKHIFMFVLLCLSAILSWKTVGIVYQPPISRPWTSEPPSAEKPKAPRLQIQQPSTFDMSSSFTSAFQPNDSFVLPPSPTESIASATTYATDFTTPGRKTPLRKTIFTEEDDNANDMDWTPTNATRRFASVEPPILPPHFGAKPATSPSKSVREPHSLFTQPDPNPFHHRVPPAPNATKPSAWKGKLWNPPPKERQTNFFQEKSGNGLEGVGVPKKVQRDAELFASPKLKYDNYGAAKDTGIEDIFNGMFTK